MKLFVNNVEKPFAANSLSIEHTMEERSTADVVLNDEEGDDRYSQGTAVEIWDGTDLAFGGIVEKIVEKRIAKGPGIYHTLNCSDWHYLADKRLAAEAYESADAGSIVMDLWSKYLREEGIRAYDYRSVVLDSGPKGYWRLGELEGKEASDSSPYRNHGEIFGEPYGRYGALTGDPNRSFFFDGTTTKIGVRNGSAFNFGSGESFSVELWVNAGENDVQTSTYPHLVSRLGVDSAGQSAGWLVHTNSSVSHISFQTRNNGYGGALSVPLPSRGEWHHFLFTFNGAGQAKAYRNGSYYSTMNLPTVDAITATRLGVGCSVSGSSIFVGGLDEVAVYQRLLTANEAKLHYMVGRQSLRDYRSEIIADEPVGYWRLGDGDLVDQAVDSSGNGLDGIITGTTKKPSLLTFEPDDCREFDGNGSIDCGSPAELQITGAQTYEFWCRPGARASTYRMNPVAKAYGGEGTITHEGSGVLNYYAGNAGGNAASYTSHTSPALTDGEVYHVVHTRSSGAVGATWKWYINGVLRSTKTADYEIVASSLPFLIGNGYTDGYIGLLDEVAVYNKELSADRILEHYLIGTRSPKFISSGVRIEQATVNYASVTDSYEELAELSAFVWNVDQYRLLHFRSRQDIAGPRSIVGDEMMYGSVQVEVSQPKYRNRQYIKGGRDLTDEQIESQYGDGEKRAFTLGYPVGAAPKIETQRDGVTWVQETVGIKGADTGKQWYYAKGDQVLTQDRTEVALTGSDLLRVTYQGEYDVVAISEDNSEIVRMANLAHGSTGRVEVADEEPQASTREAAFERANAKIQRYGQEGRILTFDSRTAGLEVGQIVTVDLPTHGINGESMLVQNVSVRDDDGKHLVYGITLLEGPLNGSWAKLFDAIIKQNKSFVERVNIGRNEILTLLNNTQETWAWAENTTETVRACAILTATFPFDLC